MIARVASLTIRVSNRLSPIPDALSARLSTKTSLNPGKNSFVIAATAGQSEENLDATEHERNPRQNARITVLFPFFVKYLAILSPKKTVLNCARRICHTAPPQGCGHGDPDPK